MNIHATGASGLPGDAVRHPVKWSGRETVNEISGGVKLKFYLRDAELYGFQFADS